MNGTTRINDQNSKAQLAAKFNEFYLQTTSPAISQIGNYRIIDEIGEGAFGKVYLANHMLLNVNVVLKCGLIDDPNIVREIYYHKQLKHKNIVKLYEIIKTESHLWLALEYCEGNELFYYIYEQRKLDIETTKKLFNQILTSIKYVHSLNLAHRDLKLENILLADKERTIVKLTDFGFVREFNPYKRQFLSTVCGTTVYMAPELLKNEKYSGFLIDIWSLGVILFTMLYGEMPFDEDDDLRTKFKIVHDEPIYRDSIPPEAIALLKKMLSKDPRARPTLTEIISLPFLNDPHKQALDLRSRRSSLYNDNESIISINHYYNLHTIPFQSKLERHLLKKLQKLNINIEYLQQSVINGETNSLTAFYDLSLAHEFQKKKKRYMKEKKLKYYEAKRTLKRSRRKVKSALSLSDQNYSGAQPLERIISSLSLSSSKNVNGPNNNHNNSIITTNNTNLNTPSNSDMNSPPLENASLRHASILASLLQMNNGFDVPAYQRTVSFHPEEDRRRTSNVTAMSSIGSENLKKRSKNNKILNKLQFWKRNRRSIDETIAPHAYENNAYNNYMGNTESTTSSLPLDPVGPLPLNETNLAINNAVTQPLARQRRSSDVDMDEGLQINVKPKTPTPPLDEHSTTLGMSSPGSIHPRTQNGSDHQLNEDNENSQLNGTTLETDASDHEAKVLTHSPQIVVESNSLGNDTIEGVSHDPNLKEEHSNDTRHPSSINGHLELNSSEGSPSIAHTNSESYYISAGSRIRTRPSSMISQMSQLSHLSQLSTMMSESELDILDETSMDDEFDDDEGVYESSINMSQHDFPQQKYLSSGMTPGSSVSMNNSSSTKVKKRPSYVRNLSSDISIVSNSTSATGQNKPSHHSKKLSLSQVSSNSSEESLILNNMNYSNLINTLNSQLKGFPNSSTPIVSFPTRANDLDSTLLPAAGPPDFFKNSKKTNQKSYRQHPKLRSNRPVSPKASPKASPKSSSSKLNQIANGNDSSNTNKFKAISSYPFGFKSMKNGTSNGDNPVARSHSPPIPNKFNKLKRTRPPKSKMEGVEENDDEVEEEELISTSSLDKPYCPIPVKTHHAANGSSVNDKFSMWSSTAPPSGRLANGKFNATAPTALPQHLTPSHTPHFESADIITEEEENEE